MKHELLHAWEGCGFCKLKKILRRSTSAVNRGPIVIQRKGVVGTFVDTPRIYRPDDRSRSPNGEIRPSCRVALGFAIHSSTLEVTKMWQSQLRPVDALFPPSVFYRWTNKYSVDQNTIPYGEKPKPWPACRWFAGGADRKACRIIGPARADRDVVGFSSGLYSREISAHRGPCPRLVILTRWRSCS